MRSFRVEDPADEPQISPLGVLTPAPFALFGGEEATSPAINGWIDSASSSVIEGWAWNPGTPAERVALQLVKDDEVLLTALADWDRPSLIDVGIGDGRHAFHIDLPPGLLPPGAHTLILRCTRTGAAVPGPAIVIEVAAPPRPPALRWHIDEINDTGIVGWIFAPNDPTRRCVVALKEGSRLHARAAASRFRPGLAEAGLSDGHCAFLLPLPRALLDGEEHLLDIVEELTGQALTDEKLLWRCTAGTAGAELTGLRAGSPLPDEPDPPLAPVPLDTIQARHPEAAALPIKTRLLFDISDLLHYIGSHSHLSGIQRVQVSIVLALLEGALPRDLVALFISYNEATRRWEAVPIRYLVALLRDLFLPELHRITRFAPPSARAGHLRGAQAFDTTLLDDGTPSVICLLGAGWNKPDHFHRILTFKRRYATRFVMLVHDLISIFARETCHEPTAEAFEAFLRRAARHTDHFLAVSQHTANDLRRFAANLGLAEPSITVTRNGSSFDEFLPARAGVDRATREDLPARFVLYVSTIEGRKNHRFLLDLWRRLIANGDNPPHLVCVGRIGWRSERFIADLVESSYLNGLVILLEDVSDAYLRMLYETCLFTVYPSLYEGWGLPVGESLAAGKICVCSTSASLPEVAGDLIPTLDPSDPAAWHTVLRALLNDEVSRRRQEMLIRSRYNPLSWSSVATGIAAACDAAAATLWQDPYPVPFVPYATEISFAHPGRPAETAASDNPLPRIRDARRGHFLLAHLTEASFVRGEESRAAGIWAEPEPWGTWLCHTAGDLVMALGPCTDALYYVFLRLRTSGPVAGAPAKILANGELAWQGSFTGASQNLMLCVHRRGIGEGGWRLRLRVEVTAGPHARTDIACLDRRCPMVGFERLLIVAENDVKTRLDVLTTLQLAAAG